MTNKIDRTPLTLDDFVYYDDATEAQIRAIVSGEYPLPNMGTTGLLLYGPAGTGKTALARRLPNLIEIAQGGEADTSWSEFYACGEGDDNGAKLIKDIRNVLTKNPLPGSNLRFIVLDEVDNLNPKTQTTLKGVMNESLTLFILTTNNIARLDSVLKDRCLPLPFLQAPAEKWLPLARLIAADRGLVGVDDEHLLQACKRSHGSARELNRQISNTANDAAAMTAAFWRPSASA